MTPAVLYLVALAAACRWAWRADAGRRRAVAEWERWAEAYFRDGE